jgi:hypothetical protein
VSQPDASLPHTPCYPWHSVVLYLRVSSDSLIGVACVAMSVTLAYVMHLARRHTRFQMMFPTFGLLTPP